MAKRREYSPETKGAALAALLEGQSITKVAKDYKIPEGTIKSWRSRLTSEASNAIVATDKKERVGELLIDYLERNLKTLRAQAEAFANIEWLMGQDADKAAVLHGVMTDKTVRLLEALGRHADAEDDAE